MDRDEHSLDRPADAAPEAPETPAVPETPEKPEDRPDEGQTRRSNRIYFWWGICGAYLLYLAYSLLQSYLNGETETTRDVVVCLGGAGLFTVAAAVLLTLAIRHAVRAMRQSAEDMRRVADEDRAAEAARRRREAEDEALEALEEAGAGEAPDDGEAPDETGRQKCYKKVKESYLVLS